MSRVVILPIVALILFSQHSTMLCLVLTIYVNDLYFFMETLKLKKRDKSEQYFLPGNERQEKKNPRAKGKDGGFIFVITYWKILVIKMGIFFSNNKIIHCISWFSLFRDRSYLSRSGSEALQFEILWGQGLQRFFFITLFFWFALIAKENNLCFENYYQGS